jgi:hypothetical protein
MRPARWLIVAASFFVGACATATDPSRSGVEFTVAEESRFADQNPSTPLTANASSAPGAVVIMGRIRTATPCWDLEQHVTRLASSINVTITARERTGVCSQVIAVRVYTLKVNAVASGPYVIHVAHEYVAQDGRTWREAVLEKDLHVQ